MASRKTGDWAKAREIFETMAVAVDTASQAAIKQEAHFLQGEIKKGIVSQAPGGKAFKPLSPLTLVARRLAGLSRRTKALIVYSDLLDSIRVERYGKGRFIGILRTARGKKSGESMVNVGQVHEYGAGPFVIPLTEKVRRYLAVLLKAAKLTHEPDIPRPWWLLTPKANPKKTLIIRIPARPFIRPIFEAFGKPDDVKRRLEERMAELLKGKLAK